jgi:hypothetical protein
MGGGVLAGGILPVALMAPMEAMDRRLGILPPSNDPGTFVTGNPQAGYTLITNNDYWTIDQGPIIEDTVGYKPFIKSKYSLVFRLKFKFYRRSPLIIDP